MGTLQYYHSLSQKDEIFTTRTIESEKEFDDFFVFAVEQKKCYWRGVARAKFKFYSSLQRYWILNDMPDDVAEVVKYIEVQKEKILRWRRGIIPKYMDLTAKDKYPSVFSLWSIMRHYDVPTPLTDWTRNAVVAMYFMSDLSVVDGLEPIDEYSSIYLLEDDHVWANYDVKSNGLSADELNRINEFCNNHPEKKGELASGLGISVEELSNQRLLDKIFCERSVLKYAQTYEGVALRIEDRNGDLFSWGINNNLKIIAQDGLFLYHVEPIVPLEDFPSRLIENYAQKPGSATSDVPLEERENRAKEILKGVLCYNVNRKLHPYIRRKIANMKWNVHESTLHPNLDKLAEELLIEQA